jgi:hypothetical protein
MNTLSGAKMRTTCLVSALGLSIAFGLLTGCKAKQTDSSAKEFQAKVGTGLGPLNLIGLDPTDGKVKIRSCTTDEQKKAVLSASGDIVDGILPVDFTKCPSKGIDELGQAYQDVLLETYKKRLAKHLGTRDFSQDESIIASSYLDLEALIRAYGKKEFTDRLGQIDKDRSDIDGLILQPGAVLDDVEDNGDYLRRAEDAYNRQIANLEDFKQYRVRPQDQETYDKVIVRLQALLEAQKANWSETQKYKYIMMHIEGKLGSRESSKLISSKGTLYESAIFPMTSKADVCRCADAGAPTAISHCAIFKGGVAASGKACSGEKNGCCTKAVCETLADQSNADFKIVWNKDLLSLCGGKFEMQ